MRTPQPTTLITLSGPAGSVDVAARSDRPLHELASAVKLGLGSGPVIAGHYRVGADPKEASLHATLNDLGALDGDAIVYYDDPQPDRRELP
jgi:hypothetical protein